MKKCKHTCPRLQRLKRSSHEKIRNWASIALDAVENEKVHDLLVKRDYRTRAQGGIAALEGPCACQWRRTHKACEVCQLFQRKTTYFVPLICIEIRSSDYWTSTDLYINITKKLAEDGPTAQAVQCVGHHVRLLRRKRSSNVERHTSSHAGDAADIDEATLGRLCGKLLEYARLVKPRFKYSTDDLSPPQAFTTQQMRRRKKLSH